MPLENVNTVSPNCLFVVHTKPFIIRPCNKFTGCIIQLLQCTYNFLQLTVFSFEFVTCYDNNS